VGGQWTDKRDAFLRHYVSNGFNATAAARSAGYTHANQQGPALVKLGIFQEHLAEFFRSVAMSPEECLARVARVARGNVVQFYELGPNGQPRVNWQRVIEGEDSDLVAQIRQTSAGATLVGMDRLRALELIGKSQGLFVERVVEEQVAAPVSAAALAEAVEGLRQYEAANEQLVRGWREGRGPGELMAGDGEQDHADAE